jgi:hypothetical protein
VKAAILIMWRDHSNDLLRATIVALALTVFVWGAIEIGISR